MSLSPQLSRRTLSRAVVLTAFGGVLSACSGGGSSDVVQGVGATAKEANATAGAATISLFGYSVAKTAYDAVIPGFTSTHAGVSFQQSYGASGDQSRKVLAGAPADVVSLSIEPDITRLVDGGIVAKDWNVNAHNGIPFGSVVTIVVRKGNPKGITDWADLLTPGLEIVTPNPFSSGSAKWNLLAPYAALSKGGTDQPAGLAYLDKLITGHIKVQPGSGREATETFLQGTGDVLLSYEDEAIAIERKGESVEHVTPPQTFKIENPVAVTTNAKNTNGAKEFVDYLYTAPAQLLFAQAGFRPVDEKVAAVFAADFPTPDKLWTITDLGGWAAVDKDLFDKKVGKVAVIYDKLGG